MQLAANTAQAAKYHNFEVSFTGHEMRFAASVMHEFKEDSEKSFVSWKILLEMQLFCECE
jgi:hypothetical protein